VVEWRAEVLENMTGASNGAFEVCLWAVENSDDAMFKAAIGSVRAKDKAGVIDLLEKAAEAGMFRAIADCIPLARDLGRLDSGLTQRRADIFQWALDEATRLSDAGLPAHAHHLTSPLTELAEGLGAGLRLERFAKLASRLARLVERDLLKSVREAYAKGELEEVVRLGENSADILRNDPDAAIIVARSLQSSGRSEDAIEFLASVQSANPHHFGARRWLARYAAFAHNYALAINMYGGLDRSHPGFAVVAPEAERFFATVEPRATKQLRELFAADRADEAFALVDALKTYTGAQERCERELARKHGNLRKRLMEIERGEGDLEEREPILRMMLRIDPADTAALRRLGLECMRQFRFAEAAECWERLRSLSPDNESVVRNRERCQILAQRRANSLLKQAAA
jgi:tetratricopeptide (TPR) repeat protein